MSSHRVGGWEGHTAKVVTLDKRGELFAGTPVLMAMRTVIARRSVFVELPLGAPWQHLVDTSEKFERASGCFENWQDHPWKNTI